MKRTRPEQTAAPVANRERIVSIDILRGFAVLGILIVNLQGFARVPAAYSNPTSGSAFDGAEPWIWAVVYILADTKFISIFSMLFGAGIAMMSERMISRGLSGTGLHYRRQFWLLVIGLVHAYLIWHGDILVVYALCGFLLYPLRKLPPRTLLWIGGCAVAVVIPLWTMFGLSLQYWPETDRAALAADWAPPPEVLESQITAFRGNLSEQMSVRVPTAFLLQTVVFLTLYLWRAGGLMLVGMGLYKLCVLNAAQSRTFYRRMVVIGLASGFPVTVAGATYLLNHRFAFETSMFLGALFNYVGSVGIFLGYVGLVLLIVQRNWLPALRARLAATGRMALTNYIMQSIICTFIFYGHGLGLFERVGAPIQVSIVIGIWFLQLTWSPWWLTRYCFGPLEWLWRSASYMRLQPMRRHM